MSIHTGRTIPVKPVGLLVVALVAAAVGGFAGAAAAAPRGEARAIDRQIRAMTLEEKVGQLFVANVYGKSANTADPQDVAANRAMYGPGIANARDLIDRYKLGGVAYFRFSNNTVEPGQIARLSNGIQRAALRQRSRIPMLIGTDQEQGLVSRVWSPATEFPGNMALGATRRSSEARAASGVTAAELRALGINQNYAPVADVNVNPLNPVIGVRSFGGSPALVSSMTAASVIGTQRAGVAATLKHFPGHGDTVTDSHTGVPWIFHNRRQWERIDAPPFRAGIAAGADVVMTAHVVMPDLQRDCDVATQVGCDPATLAPEILTGLLRRKLGFRGVVITDALNMAGVREKYGDERIPVLALKAGADLLLMVDTPTDTLSLEVAYRAVLNAVRGGELTEARIDRSVRRVLALKRRRGLFARRFVDAGKATSRLGTRAHRAVARRVSNESVTLVKNDAGLLPLGGLRGKRVLVTGYRVVASDSNVKPATDLASAFRHNDVATDLFETGTAPSAETVAAAVERASASDVVVVATSNASGSETQRNLVTQLLATGKPVVVVATRNPYDIADLPQVGTYIASYSSTRPAMWAAARVLLGRVDPTGRLPVQIPAAGQPRTTLYPFGFGLGYR